MTLVHASAVVVEGVGVLIQGPSGSGKSDLALRLVDGGGLLISDDQVDLAAEGGHLIARAPATIAGLIEARGIGIRRVSATPAARLSFALDLVRDGQGVERLPEPAHATYLGIDLPLWRLAAFEVSTAAKVRLIARDFKRQGA